MSIYVCIEVTRGTCIRSFERVSFLFAPLFCHADMRRPLFLPLSSRFPPSRLRVDDRLARSYRTTEFHAVSFSLSTFSFSLRYVHHQCTNYTLYIYNIAYVYFDRCVSDHCKTDQKNCNAFRTSIEPSMPRNYRHPCTRVHSRQTCGSRATHNKTRRWCYVTSHSGHTHTRTHEFQYVPAAPLSMYK